MLFLVLGCRRQQNRASELQAPKSGGFDSPSTALRQAQGDMAQGDMAQGDMAQGDMAQGDMAQGDIVLPGTVFQELLNGFFRNRQFIDVVIDPFGKVLFNLVCPSRIDLAGGVFAFP
jgi:hypothetical protein